MCLFGTATPRHPRQSAEGEVPLSHENAISLASASLDKKAKNPLVLFVEPLVHYCGHFVILSGGSGRQVRAIAMHLKEVAKEMGLTTLSMEGLDVGKWVVLDLGDVVVHIFEDRARGFYDLEGLWSDAERVEVPGVQADDASMDAIA
ncbi:MAG: ribosome silencing factor [Myxococcota bacterium]|nr:ribosome silencing factor [Myxococcota bacterium]